MFASMLIDKRSIAIGFIILGVILLIIDLSANDWRLGMKLNASWIQIISVTCLLGGFMLTTYLSNNCGKLNTRRDINDTLRELSARM